MKILGAFMVPHPPLIVDEIGKDEIKKIKKTYDSYNEVAKEIARLKPDTIIVSSPHAPLYSDYFSNFNVFSILFCLFKLFGRILWLFLAMLASNVG